MHLLHMSVDNNISNDEFNKLIGGFVENFKGILMLSELFGQVISKCDEAGVINLYNNEDLQNTKTYWVAYKKSGTRIVYYDRYGHRPPQELLIYFNFNGSVYFAYAGVPYQEEVDSSGTELCIHFFAFVDDMGDDDIYYSDDNDDDCNNVIDQ
ncbi:unnamed protein product [Acanthoscelides obtectus]|uniref:Uncharacterized protein n=1 Tax=Acanthoscelides obtectus TaxID=200917 RepID=A0A9P0KKB5_ACAOB|nr:unnamed protein product [Acanthoscelides obtectus]CAK1655788.1 hypothetical protein AOBTE_LOCUS19337 [Acanthoscelides obtectus]